MIKLNKKIYDRLILQAEEAKELGLQKLADGIVSAMPPTPVDNEEKYNVSEAELNDFVYKQLWKVALNIVSFYDAKSIDVEKISDTLNYLGEKIKNDIERSLGKYGCISDLEEPLPGTIMVKKSNPEHVSDEALRQFETLISALERSGDLPKDASYEDLEILLNKLEKEEAESKI